MVMAAGTCGKEKSFLTAAAAAALRGVLQIGASVPLPGSLAPKGKSTVVGLSDGDLLTPS